jgi:hypothetical protein
MRTVWPRREAYAHRGGAEQRGGHSRASERRVLLDW